MTQVGANRAPSVWKAFDGKLENIVGFKYRLRVDLELVIDGDVIDLNRIPLPQDSRIIDRRFPVMDAPKR